MRKVDCPLSSLDTTVGIPRCASGFLRVSAICYLLMTIHLNGEPRESPDSLTIAALVAQLGMKPDRVAVELNLEIVPRTNWETTTLKDGDRLEVVHFVGGGTVAS